MSALLKLSELLMVADRAGIRLKRSSLEEDFNLYAWITPSEEVLYIGKASSKKRALEELRFVLKSSEELLISSGFNSLILENSGFPAYLKYDPLSFDKTKLKEIIETYRWSGPYIDLIAQPSEEDDVPSHSDVERILIRIAVRMGRVIGNSQFSGQWESQLGQIEDTIASIAVDACREENLLPKTPSLNHRIRELLELSDS